MADHYGSTSSSLDSYRKRDLGSTLGDYMTRGHGTGQSRHMDGKGIWETRERQCMIRRYVVITTYGMTTSATGEIQKYNFGHSLCKYIMYWDSPIPLDQGMSDLHSAVHEKFWFTTQGAFLHQKTLIT